MTVSNLFPNIWKRSQSYIDERLVTLNSSYQIKLSPQLAAPDNIPGHLYAFGKRPFLGPEDQSLWPFPESITWHQKEIFRRR
ncbi:MAG: hypothetical protein H6653_14210 [Ardenticatenaceae bacterium]|nr:hypothetical protein [Ardenticatenaceae bacterium]